MNSKYLIMNETTNGIHIHNIFVELLYTKGGYKKNKSETKHIGDKTMEIPRVLVYLL